jgi:hypothetical protein
MEGTAFRARHPKKSSVKNPDTRSVPAFFADLKYSQLQEIDGLAVVSLRF